MNAVRSVPGGGTAKCSRCGAVLYRDVADGIDRTLVFTVASLILIVIANVYPLLTFKMQGREESNSLIEGSIELEPGSGEARSVFEGLETPPVVSSDAPGRKYILLADLLPRHSSRRSSWKRAGRGPANVRIHASIKAPFDALVRERTRFWNASGIEISTDAAGLKIKTESLQALLAGGIAFETASGAK